MDIEDEELELPDEELTEEGLQEAAGERSLAGTVWKGGSRAALPSLLSQNSFASECPAPVSS